jgi:hypothetical protein
VRQKEIMLSYSAFYSIWAFNGLDEAHPYWGRQFALFSVLIQKLTISGNTDMGRMMFNQIATT